MLPQFHGRLGLAFHFSPEAVMFWGELGVGSLLPMVVLSCERVLHVSQGDRNGNRPDRPHEAQARVFNVGL